MGPWTLRVSQPEIVSGEHLKEPLTAARDRTRGIPSQLQDDFAFLLFGGLGFRGLGFRILGFRV